MAQKTDSSLDGRHLGDVLPAPPEQEQDPYGEEGVERGVAEIDLTVSVIQEASLLDDESDVLGEVIPKEPRTAAARPVEARGSARERRED